MSSNLHQFPVRTSQLKKWVSTRDGTLHILEDIELAVQTGEAAAILGASGCGKSTLLSLLAGLDLPSDGEVWLFERPLSTLNEDGRAALRAGRVGFVFQSFQLLGGMTALENVMLPLELAGQTDARARAEQALADCGLAKRLQHYPSQLSGGEQQRVAVARAFAPRPELLFADEPTANLDEHTGGHIAELLFRLREQQQTTLLLVTHDEQLAGRCDTRHRLHDGRLELPA